MLPCALLLGLSLGPWLGAGVEGSGARTVSAQAAAPVAWNASTGQTLDVGLNLDLLAMDSQERAQSIEDLRHLGLRRIRMTVNWSEIEPQAGQFEWSLLDEALNLLADAEFDVLLSLQTAPAWARRDPPPPSHFWICDESIAVGPELAHFAPPTDPEDFARFVDALLLRHAARIAAIELWHEPNILPNWRAAGPDAEDYGRLILATAPVARARAPEVLLVSAGLAPVVIDASPVCYMSDLVFLERLARAEGAPLEQVDAIGLAALGFGQSADREPWEDGLNFRRFELARARLHALGVYKPIWGLRWGRYDRPVSSQSQGFEGPRKAESTDSFEAATALEIDWLRASWRQSASAIEAGSAGFSRLYLGMPPRGEGMRRFGFGALLPAGQGARAEADGGGRRLLEAILDPESGLSPASSGTKPSDPPSVPEEAGLTEPAREVLSLAEGGRLRLWGLVALIAGLMAGILIRTLGRRRARTGRPTRGENAAATSRPPGRIWSVATFRSHLQRLVEMLAARSPASLALLYGLCILVNAFGPWPLASLSLLPMAIVALARPPLAFAAIAAALPFHYALRMNIGSRPVAMVELLLGFALAGRILWAVLPGPAGQIGREAAGRDRVGQEVVARFKMNQDRVGLAPLLWAWKQWSGISGLDRLVLLLVLWSGLSPLWAPRPEHAIYEWRTVMLEPALLYLLLRSWPDRRAAARMALDGLILGGVLAGGMALAGLAIIAGGGQAAWATAVEAEGVFRARGPYGSPNNLALYLGRLLPLLVAGLIWHRGPRRRLEALALIPVVAALLASFSRGSIVLGLPALALYGLILSGGRIRRALTWMALSGFALVLAILPFADSERVRGTFSLQPGTTAYYRMRLWQSAWRMIQDHPWLGVGLDNFLYLYRDRYVQRDVVQERGLSHPHNLVLDGWTRLGLPGLLLMLLLAIANLRLGIRRIAATAKKAGADHAMVVGALGMQIYGLAHGLIDNSFFLVDLAAMWWIAQAALLARGEGPLDGERDRGPARPPSGGDRG